MPKGRHLKERGRERSAIDSGGQDYRWKSRKKQKRSANASSTTGDLDCNIGPDIIVDADNKTKDVASNVAGVSATDSLSEKQNSGESTRFLSKQRERLKKVKQAKSARYEESRSSADREMLEDPSGFLWSRYVAWAGDKLSGLEQRTERWSRDDVGLIGNRGNSTEAPATRLIDKLKSDTGNLYDRASACSARNEPSICLLLIAASGLRAASFGKSLYDGKPVGKLFGKHIKKEEQHQWLKHYAAPTAAPTAVGTARRVHALCDSGYLSLESCSVLIIDMDRDIKLRNILEMNSTRHELFDFIHSHVRSLLKTKKLKLMLHFSGDAQDSPCDTPQLNSAVDHLLE